MLEYTKNLVIAVIGYIVLLVLLGIFAKICWFFIAIGWYLF